MQTNHSTMASKLFLSPSHSSLFSPFFSLIPKPPTLSLSSRSQTQLPHSLSSSSYGPSLSKGTFLEAHEPEKPAVVTDSENTLLEEEAFARVFEIAAIRVPSKDCYALESRLRGHLLNWPRIRNIARVPGDDFDGDDELFGDRGGDGEDGGLVSVSRRVHGRAEGDGEALCPVLARDEIARKFNSRGFVRFRNLARISRPRKRKKVGRESPERIGKRELSVVEVVGDENGGEDLKGLLGEGFVGPKKWRGPTRLLLLDERCSTKCLDELPEAIKVIVSTLLELDSSLFGKYVIFDLKV